MKFPVTVTDKDGNPVKDCTVHLIKRENITLVDTKTTDQQGQADLVATEDVEHIIIAKSVVEGEKDAISGGMPISQAE